MSKRQKGEGSIFYREDRKRWIAQMKLEGGKYKTRSAKTQREASEKLKKMQRELEQETLATGPQQTVKQYLEYWLEEVRKPRIRLVTYIGYRDALDNHLIPTLGHIQLRKLTPEHIQSLYARKLEEGFLPSTIKYIHEVLHTALVYAVRRKRIVQNPCNDVELPRVTTHEISPLTSEQAHKLLEAARGHRLEGLLVVALATGMRRGELLALRWQDIDFEKRTLQVRRTVTRLPGRGFVESEPKTPKSRRTLILPQFVLKALKQHHMRQMEVHLQAGTNWRDSDLVFCNIYGRYLDPGSLHDQFAALLKKAGLPHMRFHDLRHSAATMLLGMGIPMKVVQELLGHSSFTITADIYSHVLPSMLEGAMDKWDHFFEGRSV